MSPSPLPRERAEQAEPLVRFVEARHASPRLRNALQAASEEDSIPFATVADYLSSPNPQTAMMQGVRNLGLRSANELDRIIRLSRSERQEFSVDPDDAASPDEIDALLLDVSPELSTVSAGTAIIDAGSGGRLARLLDTEIGDADVWTLCNRIADLKREIARIPGVGDRTADDLVAVLRVVVSRVIQQSRARRALHDATLTKLFGDAEGPIWLREPEPTADLSAAAATVHQLLGGMTVGQAFGDEPLRPRLASLVTQPLIASEEIAVLLLDQHAWSIRIGRLNNTGRVTISEFWEMCWRRLAAAATDLPADERVELAQALGIKPEQLEADADDILAAALAQGDDRPEVTSRVSVPSELPALVDFMLDRIRPRCAEVIRRRFGFDGPPETLEELGIEAGVTRERIRQIESRGLRELKLLARRLPLRQAVDGQALTTWHELAGDELVLLERNLVKSTRNVSGCTLLALEVLVTPLSEWLDALGTRYAHGWLKVCEDREPIDRALELLDASGLPPLPRSIEEFGIDAPRSALGPALQIGLGLRIHAGYAITGRFGVRARRTLDLHAGLAGSRAPLPSPEILRQHRTRVPADRCSQRDISISMGEAPHLFLEISEERWIALGRGGSVAGSEPPSDDDDRDEDEQTAEPDGSLAAALVSELERAGPQALSQLTTSPRRWLPRDRSENSIGPTLIMRPDLFTRMLPGVYCLPHQIPSHDQTIVDDLPFLLNDTQARLFATARRAGEPWGTFPLWTPAAEMRLCRWADRSSDAEVLRSLLDIATIDAWPTDQDEIRLWKDRRVREARFDLFSTLRTQAVEVRPSLERLLAALVDLEQSRTTNWMALNRIDGRRIDTHSGCALLAVLILLGAVSQPGSDVECPWQLPHHLVAPRTSELRQRLTEELKRTGSLEWSSTAGAATAAELRSSDVTAPAWLDLKRFRANFEGFAANDISTPITVSLEDVAAVGSRLLAERRLGGLLDWLDNQ